MQVRAYVQSEKYKEGKSVIEKYYIRKKHENVVPPLAQQEKKKVQSFDEVLEEDGINAFFNYDAQSYST